MLENMWMEPITSQASQRLHRCESREDDPRTLRLSPPRASVRNRQGQRLGESLRLVGNDHRSGNEAMSIIGIYWDLSPVSLTNSCWITTSLLNKTQISARMGMSRSCTLCLCTLVSCVRPSLLQSGKSQTVAIGKYLHLTSQRQAYPPHLSKPTTEHLSE